MVRDLGLESVIPKTFVDSVYHRLKTSSEVGQRELGGRRRRRRKRIRIQ
jgi:hypothetical protein